MSDERVKRAKEEFDKKMSGKERPRDPEIGSDARGSSKIDKDRADSGRHPSTGPKDAPSTGAKGRDEKG